MPIVSNSSPLILYSRIGRSDILRELFGVVLIPPAVYEEVVRAGARRPGASVVELSDWIQVQAVAPQSAADAQLQGLDRGEAEAIALALQAGVERRVLIDDRKGRRYAIEQGLSVLGSAGTLVLAKQRGAIAHMSPLLESLLAAGLHLSETTRRRILQSAGE